MVLERGEVGRDRHHQAEDRRDQRERAEACEDEEKAELLELRLALAHLGRRPGLSRRGEEVVECAITICMASWFRICRKARLHATGEPTGAGRQKTARPG